MKNLIWFRQDLRIRDHAAVWHATQNASCIGYVALSPEQWQLHDDAPIKIDFYLRQLQQLKQHLQQLNIPLIIQVIPRYQDIAEKLFRLCSKFNIQHVHANAEFAVYEQQRDALCQQQLQQKNIGFYLHQDRTLFPIGHIRNQTGQPYKVFGAFKQNCYQRLNMQLPACYPDIEAQNPLNLALDESDLDDVPTMTSLGYLEIAEQLKQLWPVGENYAQQKLDQFIEDDVFNYQQQRDFPALTATSQLAAYLNIGILSIRQCVQALFRKQHGQFSPDNAGQQCWLDELLWREFYQHILYDFPFVSKHQPFQTKTKQLDWRNNEADLQAWKDGKTGIPIVDAGMRQLKATGWMHNRVRMICAMFLTKNLWIDWRRGEQWFIQNLIDGDLAANNGGWQWCASTGTDAVPYFRIFNPISQSQKFDAQGDYLRQWLPELAHLDSKQIHEPYAKGVKTGLDYPEPIVDLKSSRLRAIDAFKNLT